MVSSQSFDTVLSVESSSEPAEEFSDRSSGSPADHIYDGLHVQLQPTPFLIRALALSVDYGILYVASIVAFLAAIVVVSGGILSWAAIVEATGLEGETAGAIAVFIVIAIILGVIMVLTHGYFIYFEYKKNGQTPGKKIFGLRVVTLDGSPLSLGKCITRETLRYVDTMLVLPGLLAFLLTQKNQRLGDLLSGTMVAYSRHDSQESDYLYVKQSDYLYLQEALHPEVVPETVMQDYLKFAYQTFILTKSTDRQNAHWENWEQQARQYVPQATPQGLDQLTILLFFAEYCQQTLNHLKR